MPDDRYMQAPLRLPRFVTIVAVCLCAAAAFAQDDARPAVNDRQVQAAAAVPPPIQAQRAPMPKLLDDPLDEALDGAAMDKLNVGRDSAIVDGEVEARAMFPEVPPSPLRIVLLVLASLALIAFSGSVLTFVVRELRKDADERKRTQRRRVKHHEPSTPAHAS